MGSYLPPPGTADGRFAPSPTGPLHLGNLRTALLAWLFARSARGASYLRMEDLDAARVRPGAATGQLEDLHALGLDWDGPVLHQAHRLDLYRDAIGRLEAAGLVYPCYCSRAEIRAAVSAPHKSAPAYPGTCRELSRAQRTERARGGRPPALRFRADSATVAFDDALLGRCAEIVDDFVVRRGDGAPAYNLAVVVDDAAQGVGQVVRGADLVETTPRQLVLARALGLPEPAFAHVPILHGPDGRRLAKRHGAVTLAERRERGESPAEVRSWLAASVGLAEPGDAADTAGLLARFKPERLSGCATRLGFEELTPAAA